MNNKSSLANNQQNKEQVPLFTEESYNRLFATIIISRDNLDKLIEYLSKSKNRGFRQLALNLKEQGDQ